jgi:thiol-disulfide isomerase/thioredoxin
MIPPILTVLKLIDQRNMTAVNDEFSTLNNFSAAMETIPLVPNTDGSSLFSRTSKTPLVGIYFGAQWCPPCRAFSPQLSQFAKDNAANLSIVFCSADRSADQAAQFAKGKYFYTVPYLDNARTDLMKYFKINSFPTLVVLDTRKDCQVVTRWGRLAIQCESEKGQVVKRWLSNGGGLLPQKYYYYMGLLLLFVTIVIFYKF